MEADGSCVIVGGRKSLPQVYISTEAETDSSNLRHRYSSGSSSVGSVGTPNCTTPPISTSTPHHKAIMPSFGTPGYNSTGYGSFQPSSYTDAYVPPLSLNNDNYSGYQCQFPTDKKSEESIRIDSGYGRFSNSSSFNSPRTNQSSSSTNASLWDTIVSSPVQNLRQKLRGRPSYLDEGSSRGWKIQPQQVLACLIFAIILTSIGFAFLISYKHFNRDDIDKDPLNGKYGAIKLVRKVELGNVDSKDKFEFENDEDGQVSMKVSDTEQNFLLKDDVTIEEVEIMKLELEGKVDLIEHVTGDESNFEQSLNEFEADLLKNLAGSVEEILASEESVAVGGDASDVFEGEVGNKEIKMDLVIENSEAVNKVDGNKEIKMDVVIENSEAVNKVDVKSKKRKSKNANPLIKVVPVLKKTKAKSSLSLMEGGSKVAEIEIAKDKTEDIDYPDNPKFREGQPDGRVRRSGSEDADEVVFGDKFRKYKDDREGGFRKTEVVDDSE